MYQLQEIAEVQRKLSAEDFRQVLICRQCFPINIRSQAFTHGMHKGEVITKVPI